MSKSNKPLFVLVILLTAVLACAEQGSTAPQALTNPQIEQGKALFTQNCAACHATTPETVIVGPSLHSIATTSASRVENQDAKTYLELSMLDPGDYVVEGYNDLMPSTFGKTLSGEEFDALVAYLLTLE